MSSGDLSDDDRQELDHQIALALQRAPHPGGDRLLELLDELERAIICAVLTAGDHAPAEGNQA